MKMKENESARVGWIEAPLQDFCLIIQGQSPPGNTYNADGQGLPFFQGKAEFGQLYPIAVKWCSSPTKIAERDDILISIRAPVGPTNLSPSKSCIGRGLAAIRPLGGINSRYILYGLRLTAQKLLDESTGSTFDAISGQTLREHSLTFAPLGEQDRIVAEIEKQFTRLDAAVAALKRVQANLKRYRAAVLKAACEGRLVPTEAELARREGRPYEPASVLMDRIFEERRSYWEAHRLGEGRGPRSPSWKWKYQEPFTAKNSDLPVLPEGWCWASLDSLLREPLRNGHSAKTISGADGIPTFSLSAVTYGDFSRANIKNTSADPRKVDGLWVEPGDIFIERSNTPELVGTARLYSGDAHVAIFPDLLIRVRLLSAVVPAYIESVLQSFRTRQFYRRRAQGISGTMPKIDQSTVQETRVPLPPLAEQRAIVQALADQFSVIEHLESELEDKLRKAEALRQSILKSAFEGKLVQQDPNDEPATALLERIRCTATPACPEMRRGCAPGKQK